MLRKENIFVIKTPKKETLCTAVKKRFTVKNTVVTTVDKLVLFLGLSTQGSCHDYFLLKEEFPPKIDWFEEFVTHVDLGYKGFKKDYEGEVKIPHKKPRKSDENPIPKLTSEQKDENTQKSQVRIFVENAIGGMKRYYILVNKFRNKKFYFEDDVIAIAAGLWNLRIS